MFAAEGHVPLSNLQPSFFFFSANPKSFLRYWWAYFCVCYGIPLIPALWLLVVRGSDGQNVYGNATVSTASCLAPLFFLDYVERKANLFG